MLPVFDLHCDLLSYMTTVPDADPFSSDDIGSSLISLRRGYVQFQIMALFSPTEPGSTESGIRQSVAFCELLSTYPEYVQHIEELQNWQDALTSPRTTIAAAIENASVFCEEDDTLDDGLELFEQLAATTGGIVYVSLTHNDENRFGGGNGAPSVGLKPDGEIILEYISGRNIALDLAHASDTLAWDVIEYIDAHALDIPVIASHSNFRSVYTHERNLPDGIAQEIIARGGLIGINFYRDFVHHTHPEVLYEHILHGIRQGGSYALAFGSDFFFSPSGEHSDTSSRERWNQDFFYDHRNSAQFPYILEQLRSFLTDEELHRLAYANAYTFMQYLLG
ncbi:MAG: membrane dipeptidase [Bacteroidota bacterium]|nr:membrane dipeptidase [Candidatus Kapabacteria bacterium]MDW8219114.1 membrane dipeptidase [Bacteroidota bacterium]